MRQPRLDNFLMRLLTVTLALQNFFEIFKS
jgi:hypothetical protein